MLFACCHSATYKYTAQGFPFKIEIEHFRVFSISLSGKSDSSYLLPLSPLSGWSFEIVFDATLVVSLRPLVTYLPLEGEKYVGGLEVPVYNPLLVHVADRSADLDRVQGKKTKGQGEHRQANTTSTAPRQQSASKQSAS